MGSTAENNNNVPGSGYSPGEELDATRAVTLSQFVDMSNYAMAVPVEPGFIENPKYVNRAIIYFNYSGKDLQLVIDRDVPTGDRPKERFTQKELNGVLVESGLGGHFHCEPFCYKVTVSQFVDSESGEVAHQTREGFDLAEIANSVITYGISEDGEGLTETHVTNAKLQHWAQIVNNTEWRIDVIIGSTAQAYPMTEEQIMMHKTSRKADRGCAIIGRQTICSKSTWNFKRPSTKYVLRALQVPRQDNSNAFDHIISPEVIAPATNYCEMASTTAKPGQIVVAFADPKRNGAIVLKTFNYAEIKPVRPDIVRTAKHGIGV